ncbi:flagellar hook-associated protein FlgK [Pseudobutyrivibrio xylanivorans]|uniref:Flagellar hook-associated protein 1 n=1 Tax=Pseudobutyrivibrio xylanivorans TaxID=185007 RepID=A0A5P6VNS8_PSEXY|nr:flagellar basal body protein [Pseudobutyrivibrio xylanivorans]QFJ54018.1 flagellar hook-associated protein FlgK [Pseudobutyrivibrio xylanivorans]
MANSFGSLYVGASGLQSASHGLNTTANNLSNINVEGYVREQVVYEDKNYQKIGEAAVSIQQRGLGVQVGTIVHARDMFLDKAYRQENGRHSFYDASSEAVQEVITHLQELDGEEFKRAIENFEEAFEEFAKNPSDTVNQNLVLQKASLFLDRAKTIQDGFEDYQTIINSKIKEKLERINKIGAEIVDYNKRIQTIESGKVEQAMELRDKRDLLLDELSGLVRMSYREDSTGIVHVEIEGVEFIDEVQYHPVASQVDKRTGYVTPYWPHLSEIVDEVDESQNYYYPIFDTTNVSSEKNSDIGEIKAMLMARGTGWTNYLGFLDEFGNPISSDDYESGIATSIMMNSEAELDTLIHQLVTDINEIFAPTTEASNLSKLQGLTTVSYTDADGLHTVDVSELRVLDEDNCSVGSDKKMPPKELFVRVGCERFTKTTLQDDAGNPLLDADGNEIFVYLYNEEDITDTATCYTLKSLSINTDLIKQEAYLPHLKYQENSWAVDYELGVNLSKIWNKTDFNLNPSDTTPCGYNAFYVKWIGEVGNVGNVYKSTAKALEGTKEEIEFSRQGVIGVSSDEELTIMIKYQSAYNAASRYINVVNEMIEHVVTSLGNM